jgi:hypothetical protein
MYDELKLGLILKTLATLRNRIAERFPGSGLSQVADELYRIGVATEPVLERIRRPSRLFRAGIAVAVILIVALAGSLIIYMPLLSLDVGGIGSLLQAVESAAQNLIFLSLAIYFLITLESRLHRRIALQALHRLRSIVHIVDMHQLTKDPERLRSRDKATASSPAPKFTRFELARYLDYCSELLSLSSKLAALHVQYVNDPVVLDAVNDIEVLASNLSNKMWHKIVILDSTVAAET